MSDSLRTLEVIVKFTILLSLCNKEGKVVSIDYSKFLLCV